MHQSWHTIVVYNSATTHVAEAVRDGFANQNTFIAVILEGLTAILQGLDYDFIVVYRHHYQKVAHHWACKNCSTELVRAHRRMLGTHFNDVAYKYATSMVHIAE